MKKKKTAKKTKKMQQTHGKVETFQPTTLDQVWGDDGTGKYSTNNENQYVEQLKDMTRVDVQAHATQIGLIPVQNRDVLEQRLLREFRKHWSQFKRPTDVDGSVEISQEVISILEEGR